MLAVTLKATLMELDAKFKAGTYPDPVAINVSLLQVSQRRWGSDMYVLDSIFATVDGWSSYSPHRHS